MSLNSLVVVVACGSTGSRQLVNFSSQQKEQQLLLFMYTVFYNVIADAGSGAGFVQSLSWQTCLQSDSKHTDQKEG